MDYLPDIGRKPDWGLEQDGNFDVDEVKLGDGYTQRRPRGLHPVQRSWGVSWTGITKQDKDFIVDFLYDLKGVEAFLFKDPDDDSRVFKVVCPKAPKFAWAAYDNYNVSATFVEDFNP